MGEHLPECPSGQRKWQRAEAPMYGALCICRELRACEQRVRREVIDRPDTHATYVYRAGRMAGQTEGLDAAREAVEQASSLLQPLGPALAAIDALKETP